MQVGLIEGHNGILKVTMNDAVIYDNGSECGRLPSVDEITQIVGTTKQ
jgi:hypothetical protein